MGKVQIVEDTFGSMLDPITGQRENVRRFTFTNDNGVSVQVITYGATITSVRCPDKYGNIADIVLGFDDLEGNFMRHYFFLEQNLRNDILKITSKCVFIRKIFSNLIEISAV